MRARCRLSGMLAAGLAVNEAYPLHERRDACGWATGARAFLVASRFARADWLQSDQSEPALTYLPSRLWLIGLGHLGQAFLVGVSACCRIRSLLDVALVLQDIDVHYRVDGEHFYPDRLRHDRSEEDPGDGSLGRAARFCDRSPRADVCRRFQEAGG